MHGVQAMTDMIPTVIIRLPQPLFQRLQRIAETTHRSVEDVLTTTVTVALPPMPDIPDDLADELAAMVMFNDESLKAMTQSSLSAAQQERLTQLTYAGGTRPLTEAEKRELKQLLDLYDRAVLYRARALAILAQRGYDIDVVGTFPTDNE
jgi:hypothetical protein